MTEEVTEEIIDDMTDAEVEVKKTDLEKQLKEQAYAGIEPAPKPKGRKPADKTFINISGHRMYGVANGEEFTLDGVTACSDGVKNAIGYGQIKEA